jgi:hypothetical protein
MSGSVNGKMVILRQTLARAATSKTMITKQRQLPRRATHLAFQLSVPPFHSLFSESRIPAPKPVQRHAWKTQSGAS